MENFIAHLKEVIPEKDSLKLVKKEAENYYKQHSLDECFATGLELYQSENFQIQEVGVFLVGYAACKNTSALSFLKDTVSQHKSWKVQEILAMAFDNYCKIIGYGIDCYGVILHEFFADRKDIKLLYLYGSSADTVIEQHIKFQASFPADLDQIGHIKGLEKSDHWIGRFHPKRIRRSPCRIFGINFFWHTNLRLLRFPDWVAHDRFQSAHIAFSRIAQIDFVMVSCIRNIQFVSIVKNKEGEVSSCDLSYNAELNQFNEEYLKYTAQVAASCQDRDLSENSMVIGTSAIIDTEIDGAVGMNSGIFNNPFIIWGRYKKKWFRYYLPISFQFHHTQMDGAHAGAFLKNLQDEINLLK